MRHFAVCCMLGCAAFLSAQIGGDATFRFLELSNSPRQLRGKVLPVGGVKEKILAAKRANIKEIVLSEKNQADINEIPSRYLKGLQFHFVTSIEDVLAITITKQRASSTKKR